MDYDEFADRQVHEGQCVACLRSATKATSPAKPHVSLEIQIQSLGTSLPDPYITPQSLGRAGHLRIALGGERGITLTSLLFPYTPRYGPPL